MQSLPNRAGRFGEFGGRYVAETLMPALAELEAAYRAARRDPKFKAELERYSADDAVATAISTVPVPR